MKVGILGGGQLAQMLAQSGIPLGMEFVFVSPEKQPCSAPFGDHICAEYEDPEAIKELIKRTDVVTYEFENIPVPPLELLELEIPLYPPSKVLKVAQDRFAEKQMFSALGIPVGAFLAVDDLEGLRQAVEKIGLPAVLKTRTQGYDGKGQVVLRNTDQLETAWDAVGHVPCIVEQLIKFDREVSIIAARDPQGNKVFYPLNENEHDEGILRVARSCTNDAAQQTAEGLINQILDSLEYVGVLALELFQCGDTLLANEIAPRVHNSGHWTIEGTLTSQFENHLRAICGLPLGKTTLLQPTAMVNLIGKVPCRTALEAVAGTTLHLYGKKERPGRKIGHVTLIDKANSPAEFNARLSELSRQAKEA